MTAFRGMQSIRPARQLKCGVWLGGKRSFGHQFAGLLLDLALDVFFTQEVRSSEPAKAVDSACHRRVIARSHAVLGRAS